MQEEPRGSGEKGDTSCAGHAEKDGDARVCRGEAAQGRARLSVREPSARVCTLAPGMRRIA